MTYPTLTREQVKALHMFAARFQPDDWKRELLDAWREGFDVTCLPGEHGIYLRQIRNTFGPSWLKGFEFSYDVGGVLPPAEWY